MHPDPFPRQEIDNIADEVYIRVTEVIDPGQIWAQICTEAANTALDSITTCINSVAEQLPPLGPPSDGQYCIALFPDDNMLYRARVDKIFQNRKAVIVTYMDYGNRCELGFDHLYQLSDSVLNYPLQCFECSLVHIKPSYKESSEGYWSPRAIQYFNKMASNRVCVVINYYCCV